jgi:hypothetical protein
MPRAKSAPLYDVVYYWVPEKETWDSVPCDGRKDADLTRADLVAAGYRAVRGCTRIGPPEGPPQ